MKIRKLIFTAKLEQIEKQNQNIFIFHCSANASQWRLLKSFLYSKGRGDSQGSARSFGPFGSLSKLPTRPVASSGPVRVKTFVLQKNVVPSFGSCVGSLAQGALAQGAVSRKFENSKFSDLSKFPTEIMTSSGGAKSQSPAFGPKPDGFARQGSLPSFRSYGAMARLTQLGNTIGPVGIGPSKESEFSLLKIRGAESGEALVGPTSSLRKNPFPLFQSSSMSPSPRGSCRQEPPGSEGDFDSSGPRTRTLRPIASRMGGRSELNRPKQGQKKFRPKGCLLYFNTCSSTGFESHEKNNMCLQLVSKIESSEFKNNLIFLYGQMKSTVINHIDLKEALTLDTRKRYQELFSSMHSASIGLNFCLHQKIDDFFSIQEKRQRRQRTQ